jgi:hypothetical protein
MSVVSGIEEVSNNYNVIMRAVINSTREGLEDAAKLILDESLTLTPQDTGNLKASAYYITDSDYTRSTPTFSNKRSDAAILLGNYKETLVFNQALLKRSTSPVAIICYSAYYASIIHENNKNYTVGQWKFLETALKNNLAVITKKVGDGVREGL